MPVIDGKFYTKAQVYQCEQCLDFFRNKNDMDGRIHSFGDLGIWLCNICAMDKDAEDEDDEDDESESDDEEETSEEFFDRKYPNAKCHRCRDKVTGATVVMCGGGGGACETWYCRHCHDEGTDDCNVCAELNKEKVAPVVRIIRPAQA